MTEAKKFGEVRNADTGEVLVEMIGPDKSADTLSLGLRILTCVLQQREPDKTLGGWFFGGAFGYGVAFENDVFLMHPYCWCEKEDCLWCGGCACDRGACRYFIDDEEVSADESWARARAFCGELPHEKYKQRSLAYVAYSQEWDERIVERDRRWRTVYPAITHTCDRRAMFVNRPEGDTWKPSVASQAPHFWHKTSGLRVRWYKYIGRDNQVSPETITAAEWRGVLDTCLNSLGLTLEAACTLYETESARAAEESKRAMEFAVSPEGQKIYDDMLARGVIRVVTFDGKSARTKKKAKRDAGV